MSTQNSTSGDDCNRDQAESRRFDEALIRTHVELLHDLASGVDGVIPLCAFGENPGADLATGRKLPNIIWHFRVGDIDGMVRAVMGLERQPHMNVYLPLAVMRSSLESRSKGGESDVVAVLGLVLDDDSDRIQTIRSPVAPNYILET